MRTLIGLLLAVSVSQTAYGQDREGGAAARFINPVDYTTAHLSRIVDAVRIDEPIRLDGVLDEASWTRAAPATNFIEYEPVPGKAASELTEVRFLYDSGNLYVGAWCFDSHPEGIVVNEAREDFNGQEGDTFTVFIDSVGDRRSGLTLSVNPAGARRDQQVSNNGDQINQDWDGVWDVKVRITDKGWFVEMVIPFKTLRFKNPASPEWGLNMSRRIRRTNEQSHWAPLPRRYRVFTASLAGTLRGFEGLEQGRNLKLKPYVRTGRSETFTAGSLVSDNDLNGGLDLKYGLTQSLTLDLTYRTDFSQVEVDQQQVNLTRFNVFFPEKREFFLENRDLFNFGVRGGATDADTNLLPFFSRKIGLGPNGNPIPIAGGARVSGRARTYDIGMLVMRTEASGSTPENTVAVGRIRKNFLTNSWIGAIATNRNSAVSDDTNRVMGVDANVQFFQRLDITSYWLRSQTPRLSGDDEASALGVSWRDDDFTFTTQYDQVQPNFNPELGFIRRRDNEHYSAASTVLPRVRHQYIRNFIIEGSADYYAKWHDSVETRQQEAGGGVLFHNATTINYRLTHAWERLATPFAIRPDVSIEPGAFSFTRQEVTFSLDSSRKISGSGSAGWGEFWDGTQTAVSGTIFLKPNYRLNADLTYNLNKVDLPSGAFTTHLVATRALYAFSTRMFLNSFLQYNADTHQFSSNIRFNVTYRPLSNLYVVFNNRRDTVSDQLLERALIVKVAHLFSF